MSGDRESKEKKGGFFRNLFRSNTSAKRLGRPSGRESDDEPSPHRQDRRASEGDLLRRGHGQHHHRSRTPPLPSSRRRPRRPDDAKAKGKGRAGADEGYDAGPLTEWPPSGMSSREELSLGHAMELISRGVPAHKGHRKPIPHAAEIYYMLYATTAGNRGDEGDAGEKRLLHDLERRAAAAEQD